MPVSKKKIDELKKSHDALYYILANNLSAYIQKTFNSLNPTTAYLHNWHIDAIADYLDACEEGSIKRLIINMPPRFMKSIAVSIAWTSYLLGRDATRKIIVASYASSLAETLSVQTRNILSEEWYKNTFENTRIAKGENKKMWFTTEERGHRYATSVGATVTGFGGDYLILDDPLKPDEAVSDTMRRKCNDWITSTFLSRANDPKNHCLVLVMQRLHEDDPSGLMLDLENDIGDFEQLILPAEFEKKTIIQTPSNIYVKEKGDFLHEKRFGLKEAEEKNKLMGSYAYAGQYLQKPAPIGGGIIKRKWFKLFDQRPFKFDYIVHSWDTALKANAGSDYSVCTIWGIKEDGYYLIDLLRAKLEYPDLKKKSLFLSSRDNPDYILIEDKASGQSLIQDLRVTTKLNIIAINPHKDKISRASSVTPDIEGGNIFLDQNAYWLTGFFDECDLFPNGKHDDQIDSMSQFLNWAKNNNNLQISKKDISIESIVVAQSAWSV